MRNFRFGLIRVMAVLVVIALAVFSPLLTHEVDDLLLSVSKVSGVTGIDNQLEMHEQAGNLPSLQGEGTRPGYHFELMQENWSPTARILAGVAGGALAATLSGSVIR